jgi:hypothetical protein
MKIVENCNTGEKPAACADIFQGSERSPMRAANKGRKQKLLPALANFARTIS